MGYSIVIKPATGKKSLAKCDKELYAELPTILTEVEAIDLRCFADKSGVGKIELPDTIKSIYMGAFRNSDVVVDDFANVHYIGGYAFENCKLDKVNFRQVAHIESRAFANAGLTQLELPMECEIKAFAFKNNKIKVLYIPKGVKLEEGVFCNNLNLEYVAFEDGCTEIPSKTFEGCKNLKTVIIPSSVKKIGERAFAGCAFEKIIIPEGMEVVEKHAFAGCKNLTFVQIPSTLKAICKGAFSDCPNIKKLVYPKGCAINEVRNHESVEIWEPKQNHKRIIEQLITVYSNDEGYEDLDNDKVVKALSSVLPHEEDEYYNL